MKRRKRPQVDSQWFVDRLKERGIPIRGAGRMLGLDAAVAHRLLYGKRKATAQDISKLAEILEVPTTEILERFGVVSREPQSTGERTIALEGYLDGHLQAHVGQEGAEGLYGRRHVQCPFPEREIRALRIQSAGSENAGLDGGIVYYRKTKPLPPSPESVGRISLVVVGSLMALRVLRRGSQSGRYHFFNLAGKVLEEDQRVDSVYPVLWLKF